TALTQVATFWFRFGSPAPEAGGESTMIWLKETDSTWASTSPKKTWRGEEKPEPMIVTRVLPSLDPEEGRTAVIVGVLEGEVPKAKQLGSESVTGWLDFVPKVSVIDTGTEEDTASGNAGVM